MNLLAKIGLLGLLAGGTASALYADPAGGWLSPNGVTGAASTSGAAQGTAGGAAGQSAAAVALPAIEIQTRVQAFREQTRADARHIQHLQNIARKEKDVIKLNCVNDKLVQVKPELNIIDNGVSELESATDANRMTVFEGIAAAAENIRHLREEADQCIGEPVQTGGDSSNSFTGPDMPDDPTKGFSGPELEPPGYASPYN
jgi:hypothetical protein